jgi:hypothetical protein
MSKEVKPEIKEVEADTLSLFKKGEITTANSVGLSGELTELCKVEQISGLRFEGYVGHISAQRPNGTEDDVIIAFELPAVSAQEKETVKAAGVLDTFKIGSKLIIYGNMQTLKDFETGRVLVYVFANFVGLSTKPALQNDVALVGKLAKKPTARLTQRGKHITDLTLITQNLLTAGNSYIPCICWGSLADDAAEWEKGDTIRLLGRCQSREYSKLNTDGRREIRTAYEVSARLAERTDRK